MHSISKGLLAGAVGTLALDVVTYGDMLLRGRPSSGIPAQVAVTPYGAVSASEHPHRTGRRVVRQRPL
ncbi:hypothetical protein ABZ651_32805, partial [Streptomyces sp. NPDC007070]